jgi:hypothetical protein
MDQNTSMDTPSKLLRELHQMCSEKWGHLYLLGFGETLAFIEAETARGSSKGDLRADTIKRVAWVWRDYDREDWSGGFVLELADGQRVYMESEVNGSCWGAGSNVVILPMAADQDLPELAENHDSKLYGWMKDPAELNEFLGRLS